MSSMVGPGTHGHSSAKSLSASSSMAVPWWLPSLESSGREVTMWVFPKVVFSTKAITVLPGVTSVASRFSLPMAVVTVSIHGLSPPTWSEGVGEAGSSPGVMVGMIWFSALAGLAARGLSDLSGCHCPFWLLALQPPFW